MTRQSLAVCFFCSIPGSVFLILSVGFEAPTTIAAFTTLALAFAAFGVAMEKSGVRFAALTASSVAVYAALAPFDSNDPAALILVACAVMFSVWGATHAARDAHAVYGTPLWRATMLFNLPMAVFISVLYSVALNFPLAAYVALGAGALISFIAAWASKRYNIFSERGALRT